MRPALIILGVLGVSAVTLITARPREFHYARSIDIAAPPELIERHVTDLRRWERWSPFDRADPRIERVYGGASFGPGAHLTWSGNDQVGAGHVAVTRVTPPKVVQLLMLIERPMALASVARFSIVPQYSGVTRVTWSLDGRASIRNRLLMGLGVLERHYDGELAAGLIMLKSVAEAEAAEGSYSARALK